MRYSQGSVHHLLFLATTAAVFSVKKQGHANSLADATPATEDLTRLQHHHFDPPGHHGSHITPPRKSGASYDERMMKADAGILSPRRQHLHAFVLLRWAAVGVCIRLH